MRIPSALRYFLSLGTLLSPGIAEASSITNLDSIPYDLQATIGGKDQTISIAPGEIWQSDARPIYVYIKGHRTELDAQARYTIWKGGTFAIQDMGAINRKSR